ncbi:hypothetical protein [Maricaulis sp.]|uniref:hypothetical protein n=1 Tax=Maricaulis sp. TaxID=1486257 RepID=UPI003A95A8C0
MNFTTSAPFGGPSSIKEEEGGFEFSGSTFLSKTKPLSSLISARIASRPGIRQG